MALLEPEERARIKGLLINKFRGDVEILRPGLAMLEEKTQLPVLGVVPYLKVDIEDEDSLSTRLEAGRAVKPLDAAILRLPHISNFTDFMPLEQHPLLGVRYVQSPRQLGTPDVVILPGTKNTIDDLLWLRQCGLEAAVLKLAAQGKAEQTTAFLQLEQLKEELAARAQVMQARTRRGTHLLGKGRMLRAYPKLKHGVKRTSLETLRKKLERRESDQDRDSKE